VVLDDYTTQMPTGMEDFIDTGYDFTFYGNMNVFKKEFTAGKVSFGTNDCGNMYTIIIVE